MPLDAASPEAIALSRLQVTEALSHLPPCGPPVRDIENRIAANCLLEAQGFNRV
jgi:hypothetical protein